jgi:Tfp pilus assembly protein PilX
MEVKMSKQQKTKQGMASIYVVVFVTMLIGVITLSFLRIMLSETGRTEKSTLADSAMNSAMAGVEDAKLAFSNYKSCADGEYPDNLSSGADITCQDIMYWVNHPDCDMVAHIYKDKIQVRDFKENSKE